MIHHLVKESGCQPECGHTVAPERLAQLFQRWLVRRQQHQLRAVKEAAPDFKGRGVECERGKLEEDLCWPKPGVICLFNQTDHAAMNHAHTFRRACRTG